MHIPFNQVLFYLFPSFLILSFCFCLLNYHCCRCMLLCKNSSTFSHTHTHTFCKILHKGAYVCSLHVALCLYTHLHLVSWYSQRMLFWWCCRYMRWVVSYVKNVTRAFRCYLYSFQMSRQEAPFISLVSCPLKSRMRYACSIFLFVAAN